MISHKNNNLHITYTHNTPAAAQTYLALSIITALRLAVLVKDGERRDDELQSLVPLIDLLEELIPDDLQMERAYEE